MGVSENSVPQTQWLMIIIPIKWLFHWEYTLFSDKPIYRYCRDYRFQEERERIRLEELRVKEQQTRQVVQELEQLLAKAEEEATKARQVASGSASGPAEFLWMGYGWRSGIRYFYGIHWIHGWIC